MSEQHEIINVEASQPRHALARVEAEMSVEQVVGQIKKIQEVMRAAMKNGEHYGVIPGTKKPTLLKAGAEKLCLTFRLAPSYQVTRREHADGHIEYEVLCELRHIQTQNMVGCGVGSCSTLESRYRWRGGLHRCHQCGKAAIIKGLGKYGGGWLCYKKKDGCGAKFVDSDYSTDKVENPDIADTYNTVLKMAKKRALVDATLTATAASDIFTHDLEDFGDDSEPQEQEPPPPASRAAQNRTRRPDQYESDESTKFWSEAKERGWTRTNREMCVTVFDECGGRAEDAIAKMEHMLAK